MVAYLLFDALDEAGFPPGVVNLVPGFGLGMGEALAGHPGIDVMSFTGSVSAGKRVAELAAANVTRVTLELGGKSANIILDDADMATAVKVGVANAFLNSGQTCTAWTRMLVPADRYDEAVELAAGFANKYAVGDPTDPSTKLGPVVNAAQRDKIRGLIDTAVAEGARVAAGGTEAPEGLERGYFVRPTVLADVAPDSTIAQEEVFGPVLSMLSYRDEDDAIAIANNSKYGLHGGVWSADPERAKAVALRMRTGSVDINGAAYNPMAPFGGYKQSGVGREMGTAGLEEYLEIKSVGLK
jgi:aldehyde dehydrogenase (NAD+)